MARLRLSVVVLLASILLQVVVSGRDVRHAMHRDEPPLGGCQEYNFKTPPRCGTPTLECDFAVSWKEREGMMVEYTLEATVTGNSSIWAAVGFSSNSKMEDADVVTCWIDDQGNFSVRNGWNKVGSHDFILNKEEINKENLRLVSTHLDEDMFTCTFVRSRAPMDSSLGLGKSLNSSWHVLVATGPLTRGDGTQLRMDRHSMKQASSCKCNVTDCKEDCSCPSIFRYQLLKLHGVIMCVTFIFLIPTGALLARYYKMAFTNSWFKGHVTMMVLGVLWSLVGFAFILGHTRGKFEVGGHQLTGVTCIGLCVIQPIVAFFRPPKQRTIKRVLFAAFHRTVAISVLVLSIVALFWGSYLYRNPVMPWMMSALGLTVLTNLGFILLLEILSRTHKFSTAPPVGYHKVTKQDELSESEEEVFVRDDPAKKMKSGNKHKSQENDSNFFYMEKGLLMLYVIQSFCFAVLISGLIFYYDSLHHHG